MSEDHKLVIDDLYKIFGPNPNRAMELLKEGHDKDSILERTGNTVGVQEASFAIHTGEVFVVMGLSGSGKSTLVRMINRLIEPTAGSVRVDGRDVTAMSKRELIQMRRHEMSMVFQSFALMPHRTVLDNAAFGLEVSGVDKEPRHKRAREALEGVGLGAWVNSFPHALSGGMKQRVGLARALATDPSIMLMDEAFSALDPLIRTEMQDELLQLQREQRRTVVFISHDLDEAIRIGDRIGIMEGGRVVQVGTPQEIVSNPADDYVRSFFYGVDVTRVYSAGDIARDDAAALLTDASTSAGVALERLDAEDVEYGVLVDGEHQFRGVVTSRALRRASGNGASVEHCLLDESTSVSSSMPLAEVVGRVANSESPVAVVDGDSGRYLGAITKTALLQTLNRTD